MVAPPVIAVLGGMLVVAPAGSTAQIPAVVPTFSDVAPILYDHCVSCHRPGEIAPMSLLTFEDARPWARSIREAVIEGVMPPWHAAEPPGTFRNERVLSAAERATIVGWVEGGAPEGDPSRLPPRPEFATGWTIGQPDAVFAMPVEFEIPASGEVEYQYFETTVDFTEDKWIQALEVRPGAREVVHHILVYSRPPDGEIAAPAFRPLNPAPDGPAERGGLLRQLVASIVGSRGRGRAARSLGALIATTAPGTNALVFPEGQAMRVRAGSTLTFQMHYTTNGTPTRDRSRIGFVFAEAPPRHEVESAAFINAAFRIPAGAPDYRVDSAIEFTEDVEILALFPHTHLRGKSWEYRLVYPDGRAEVVLSTPRYDFNWQTYYEFQTPLRVPAGSRLEATATYDNSASNRDNPDPTLDVGWGDQTWEEMQYSGITFVRSAAR
jgi:Copper type II ascorbate-dependent monooxygenase, C-terminal domain